MSIGKKWKYNKRKNFKLKKSQLDYLKLIRAGGGKKGNPGYKFIRHKKKYNNYLRGRVSMKKFISREIGFWY